MNDDSSDHLRLQHLLGAWALHACSPEEIVEVEEHLVDCAACASEADQLRGAIGLLHPHMNLDLAPALRAEVIGACLSARAPEVAVPDYAQPYDAETARLDALLADLSDEEWDATVQLEWFEGEETTRRGTSVSGVLGHLLAVDGMVSSSLGLPDPVRGRGGGEQTGQRPEDRTEAFWKQVDSEPLDQRPTAGGGPGSLRETWREHAHELIRTCAFSGKGVADIAVPYGDGVVLPLRLALLDRAFETWIHATDIAEAVDYPYPPPVPEHLRTLISVAVTMLPSILAARRQAGLASPPMPVVRPGSASRSLRLRIEGESGGEWYLPLDDPEGPAGPENCVSEVVLPEVQFCRLAAGHLPPRQAAEGQQGDQQAVVELLYAMASMSRL
ncbi:maleylpyruvate isomerase N-terminal domain-containing protein [Streptomyces sp. XM4193]|uniref:maleylpyruvate isomerase N-terminal domain-containing protein n=1 Tax=Streptomyces sp. XM4193 TaxID=2929782 RepID=UPI001FF72973|nr:maleylpyruvate isomerase N-terminal domain-containing protein [Streptomyces sp. XM4193]MCK1799125.1 maleylpyruvate isomerase N-terminal domain-containing protein [Streptomyces sp. XM4193]